jgi:hypothetical protein
LDEQPMTSQNNENSPSTKQLNEILADKERTLSLFRGVAKEHFARLEDEPSGNPELDTAVKWVTEEITVSGGDFNINKVFDHAESPIERVFLNSFLFKMSIEDALSVIVYGPVEELNSHMQHVIGEYRGFVEWLAGFFYYRGQRDLNAAYEELDHWLRAGRMPEESHHWAIHMLGANGLVDYVNAFHVMIQPTMRLNRPIRASKIIVECDGFAYHSNQAAFQRDRKDLIVSSNQLRTESGDLQRVTMIPSVQSSHVALIALGAVCRHPANAQVARTAATRVSHPPSAALVDRVRVSSSRRSSLCA